jgi:hypothetical protein
LIIPSQKRENKGRMSWVLTSDVQRTIAEELGRVPSELFAVRSQGRRIRISYQTAFGGLTEDARLSMCMAVRAEVKTDRHDTTTHRQYHVRSSALFESRQAVVCITQEQRSKERKRSTAISPVSFLLHTSVRYLSNLGIRLLSVMDADDVTSSKLIFTARS